MTPREQIERIARGDIILVDPDVFDAINTVDALTPSVPPLAPRGLRLMQQVLPAALATASHACSPSSPEHPNYRKYLAGYGRLCNVISGDYVCAKRPHAFSNDPRHETDDGVFWIDKRGAEY